MSNLGEALVELGRRKGFEIGKRQGLELVEKEWEVSLAQMMLQEKEPVEKIERYTGETLERLKEIADALGRPLMME